MKLKIEKSWSHKHLVKIKKNKLIHMSIHASINASINAFMRKASVYIASPRMTGLKFQVKIFCSNA